MNIINIPTLAYNINHNQHLNYHNSSYVYFLLCHHSVAILAHRAPAARGSRAVMVLERGLSRKADSSDSDSNASCAEAPDPFDVAYATSYDVDHVFDGRHSHDFAPPASGSLEQAPLLSPPAAMRAPLSSASCASVSDPAPHGDGELGTAPSLDVASGEQQAPIVRHAMSGEPALR